MARPPHLGAGRDVRIACRAAPSGSCRRSTHARREKPNVRSEGKRDVLVFDGEQRGLGLRVTAGGSKTYLAQYNWHGQKRRIPLGSCSALSLAKARDAVRAIMGDVAKRYRSRSRTQESQGA
jgi:hypothetical protein